MIKIGIIGEYNPFHNGHIYHIKKIKEKYPDSLLILCLNGLFLERGEISLLTKEDKTKIALNYQIDLVVELPTLFGCQSADTFAQKSIELLNNLKVDKIIFGSETNNLEYLMSLAQKETEITKEKFTKELKKGNSYLKSIMHFLNEKTIPANDLLGISYCKAVLKNHYSLELETILRTNSFHDKNSKEKIISAENIRQKIKNNEDYSYALPEISQKSIQKINEQLYFQIIKSKILTDTDLTNYLDVKEGIENKLKKEIKESSNIEEFINKITSKRYPRNYIQRMLIHIFLGITKKHANIPLDYLKILGFNENGQKYLNSIKKNMSLPTKPPQKSIIFEYEQKATILYDLLINKNTYSKEKLNKPLYIKTAPCLNESNQK